MKKKSEIKVIQSDQIVPVEVLAESIKTISDGIKKLRAGRLNDKAITFLVHKSSGVATETVRRVIQGMENLERDFLK